MRLKSFDKYFAARQIKISENHEFILLHLGKMSDNDELKEDLMELLNFNWKNKP